MEIRLEVKGLAELQKQLLGLGAKAGQKMLVDALKYAAEPVQQAMVAGAAEDTGDLKKSIVIRSSTAKGYSRRKVASVFVGPQKIIAKSSMFHRAVAQEYGNAKRVAAPFIRPALEKNIDTCIARIQEYINNNLMSNIEP